MGVPDGNYWIKSFTRSRSPGRASTSWLYCPELVITGFGDSAEEARSSLRAEIGAYLEDCETLGILDDVLIDAGFYDNDEVWMSSLVTPPREPRIEFL